MRKTVCIIAIILFASCATAEPIKVAITGEGSSNQVAREIKAKAAGADFITLRLVFDDGQMLDVTGRAADAQAYLDRTITEDQFMDRLEYSQVTRGPVMQPGVCEPDKGEDCMKNVECSCYDSQTCKPGDPKADSKGCFDQTPPKNAHKVGDEYACDEGLVWNADLSGCVEKIECPEGEVELEGKCYGKGDSTEGGSDLCCFLAGFGALSVPALALAAAVVLVIGGFVYTKRQKK